MIDQVKIGRNIIQVKTGDYVLWNGACYQYFAGDRRTLVTKGWDSFFALEMAKGVFNKLDQTQMRVVKKSEDFIKYYF